MTFFTGETILWLNDFSWKQQFEVKSILIMNFFITNKQLFALQDFVLMDLRLLIFIHLADYFIQSYLQLKNTISDTL